MKEHVQDGDSCWKYKKAKMNLTDALKGYIQRNPEEYKSEIHEYLFTEEEIKDMSQSLGGK
ncbi:hypothetical protein KJ807_05955 [Patescibacteria group bacterium]|nr:hypothetical protein [Patescibacteria group bacterium]